MWLVTPLDFHSLVLYHRLLSLMLLSPIFFHSSLFITFVFNSPIPYFYNVFDNICSSHFVLGPSFGPFPPDLHFFVCFITLLSSVLRSYPHPFYHFHNVIFFYSAAKSKFIRGPFLSLPTFLCPKILLIKYFFQKL